LWSLAGKGTLANLGVLAALTPNLAGATIATPPVVDGYEQAAIAISELPGGAAILVDAYWDGDFVFFYRQHAKDKRLCLRASKILYTYASYPWIDFHSYVSSEDDIFSLLQEYGIRYLVVEEVDQWETKPGNMLRGMLLTPKFRLRQRIPIVYEGLKGLRARYLDIYEYVDARAASADSLELHLPGLNRTIRVPIQPSESP
jgi:hypothetical protein